MIGSIRLNDESEIGDASKRRREEWKLGSVVVNIVSKPLATSFRYHSDFKKRLFVLWISLTALMSQISIRLGPVRTIGPGRNKLLVSTLCEQGLNSGLQVEVLTILLMQLMNVEWYLAIEPVVDIDKVRPFRYLRARYPREWTSNTPV